MKVQEKLSKAPLGLDPDTKNKLEQLKKECDAFVKRCAEKWVNK